MSQQLVMTPQLQQAIQLLQYSRAELLEEIQKELMENPLLEEFAKESASLSNEAGDGVTEREVGDQGSQVEEGAHQPETIRELEQAPELGETGERVKQEIDWEAYIENSSAHTPELRTQRLRDDDLPGVEVSYSRQTTLFEHLMWQLKVSGFSSEEERIGAEIIGNINAQGYFTDPTCEELAERFTVSTELVEAVLEEIQNFDPPGVASRTLQESLIIQARSRRLGVLIETLLTDHLDALGRHRYRELAKTLRRRPEEIEAAAASIRCLNPYPAGPFSSESAPYITPDVYIRKVDGEYQVSLNQDGIPRLRINQYYRKVIRQSGNSEERRYVTERLNAAANLMSSIEKRNETILKVTESILRFQHRFFEEGVEALKPLVLRQVAEDIGRSESTVSRVTSNKYVHTEQGIFELKYFFNSSIQGEGQDLASIAVQRKIRKLIDSEASNKPFSDQRLTELLKEEGITIARRTVAKYREAMRIPSSSRRRRVGP